MIRPMSTLLVPVELLKYQPEGLGEIIVFYHYMYVLQLWSLVYITQRAILSWKSATLILVTRVKVASEAGPQVFLKNDPVLTKYKT